MAVADLLRRILQALVHSPLQEQDFRQDRTALLVIDVQQRYCDPAFGYSGTKETHRTARAIARLAPVFRRAGLPVYAVAMQGEEREGYGFHAFAPEETDVTVYKTYNSAFIDTPLARLLQARGRTTLLACGFNLSACVHDTVLDARQEGFKVALLSDLTRNGRSTAFCGNALAETFVIQDLQKLYKAGIPSLETRQALDLVRRASR